MKKYLFLLFPLTLMCCSCTKPCYKDLICGGDHKYWSFKWEAGYRYTTYYFFDKNNKWIWYESYGRGKLVRHTERDQRWDDKWNLINDSVLVLGGRYGAEYKLNEVNDSLLSISWNDTTYTLKAASENDILSDTIHKNPEIPASFNNKKYKGVLDFVLKNMGKKLMKKALFDVNIEIDQDGGVAGVTFNNKDTLNKDEISILMTLVDMPKWSPAVDKGKRVRSVKRVILNICPTKK